MESENTSSKKAELLIASLSVLLVIAFAAASIYTGFQNVKVPTTEWVTVGILEKDVQHTGDGFFEGIKQHYKIWTTRGVRTCSEANYGLLEKGKEYQVRMSSRVIHEVKSATDCTEGD